jgi:hypothetical protein
VSTQQQPPPGWFVILRDVVALTFPWVLIFKQAGIGFTPPQEVSEPILWLAGSMLSVPGVAQILAFRFGGGTGTAGSPPPDQPAALPPSSSSSST